MERVDPDEIRRINRDYRRRRRWDRLRHAWSVMFGFLGALPFGRQERTRVHDPYQPGTDPRDQYPRLHGPS